MSWHSPKNVSKLTCLNSRKLSVYPGSILHELFDSLLVDEACFNRILSFITYSVNAPLMSVFFSRKSNMAASQDTTKKGKYQGFVDVITRYY